jgi:hypothetical protein
MQDAICYQMISVHLEGRSPGKAALEELFLRNTRCKQMQSLWIFAHTSFEGEPLFDIVSRDVFQENAASECVL